MTTTMKRLLAGCAIALGTCGSASAAEVTYSAYYWGESAPASYLAKAKAEFEKDNPGDTIKAISPPYEGFFDKQYTEVKAGSPSDIVSLFDPDMAAYLKQDLLEPLDEYVKAAGVSLDQLNPLNKNAMKDGHIYGITLEVNPRALMINEKLLRDAGVSIPATADEFLVAMGKLRNPAKQEFGFYSLSTSGTSQDAYLQTAPIIYGFGGGWFKEGRPTANSPETIAALKFIKKVYDDGLVPRVDSRTAQQMFIDGKIAMFIVGPFLAGMAAEQNQTTYENIAAATLPLPGKRTTSVSVFIGVPKGAKNKDAAGRLITTLLKPEMQKTVAEIGKVIPAVRGSISDEFLNQNPWFKAYVEAAGHAVSFAPEGVEEYGPEIYNIIGPAIEDILFNNADVEQTANHLQAELEKFVAAKKAN
ncbi:sugar ABC transporter substrate-binding protein [Mesorhizobium sp. M0955]|uniref:ABC transporter substrate-binding protein n=1 Tax=Mesorhizobium sp. M0955 TaxID=2957033 RepID=UPI00333D328B